MFTRIRSFIGKHHRKFVFLGLLIGGGVYLKRYAERKFIEWQEREINQLLEQSRKKQHYESTERTCNMTITSVMPQLQTAIAKTLDSDNITLLLKQKAPNKKDLWDQLKIIGVSRVVSYIYCNSILSILLRTQVNILGGHLYLANQNPSEAELELSPEGQSQYLSTSNHWLTSGVHEFCLAIEKIVSTKVATLSLKARITIEDVEKLLRDIGLALEDDWNAKPNTYLADFFYPTEIVSCTSANSLITKLVCETREIVESEQIRNLLSSCFLLGVSCVLDKLTESMNAIAADSQLSKGDEFIHPNRVEVYMAKLVPVLNNFIFHDVWPIQLLTIEQLRNYGWNIYEAFSKEN